MMEYPKKRKASTQGGRSSMKRRLQDEDEMVDDLLSISDEASLPPSLVTDDGYDVDLDSEAEEEYLEGIQAGLAQGEIGESAGEKSVMSLEFDFEELAGVHELGKTLVEE